MGVGISGCMFQPNAYAYAISNLTMRKSGGRPASGRRGNAEGDSGCEGLRASGLLGC
jgi:hypothetical protein